jgi:hypothetical protein
MATAAAPGFSPANHRTGQEKLRERSSKAEDFRPF